MNLFLWRMAASVAGLWGSLAIVMYSLERLSLIRMAHDNGQGDGELPGSLIAWFFAGFIALNLTVFYALTRWARYIRANPRTPQAPVSVLIGVVALCGGALLWGMAAHAEDVREQAVVSLEPSLGYIAFQVLVASLALIMLVLVAVRWSPGYRREFIRS